MLQIDSRTPALDAVEPTGLRTPQPLGRPLRILLVEDNPGDVRLIREAFREANLAYEVDVAEDGVIALEALRGNGNGSARPRPDMILLDLNLPRKDGREVLAEVKADPVLRSIPVIVLTTSEAEQDVAGAYDLQANCYVTKPIDFSRFMSVIGSIESFWLQTVKLPS